MLTLSCSRTTYTLENLPDAQITFGKGGGFTGAVTEYTLLENGQLFKKDGVGKEMLEIKSTKRKMAKKVFQQMNELKLMEKNFNHPGNIYYFIRCKANGQENYLSWGASDHQPDDQLKSFYEKLNTLIPKK